MKKLLFIAAVALLCSTTADAQLITGNFTGNGPVFVTSLDTVANTGTKTYIASIPNRWQGVTFQLNMADVTGDPSGVHVEWYNSVDTAGNRWDSVPYFTDTMPNANYTVVHEVIGNPALFWKAVVTGVGTHTSSYQIKAIVR